VPKRYVLDQKSAEWVAKHSRMRRGTHNQREPQFRDDSPETVAFYNDSGETVPAYGIVRVQGYLSAFDRNVLKVRKPGVASTGPGSWYMANGPREVAVGEYGLLQTGPLVQLLYHTSDSPGIRDWYGIDGFRARSYPNGQPHFQVLIEDVIDATNKLAWARLIPFSSLMIQAPAAGIPGRVGSLMGAATCTIIVMNQTNDQLAASSSTVKVYNWATTSACATGDRYGLANYIDGKWRIASDDCNDTGSTVQPGTGKGGGGLVPNLFDPQTLPSSGIGGLRTFNWSGSGTGGGPA
jgi:hypothetical protein